MPKLGEVVSGYEIGKKPPRGKFIWAACQDCGKQRWIAFSEGQPVYSKCNRCALIAHSKDHSYSQSPSWKGGRIIDRQGYILIKLQPDDFFYPMARTHGYIPEHRLVMAKHLGRCLQSWEIVHHKDGIKSHNVYSNLKLTTQGSHAIEHSKGYRDGYRQGFSDGQNTQIQELKQEIKLLQWQLKEVEHINKN